MDEVQVTGPMRLCTPAQRFRIVRSIRPLPVIERTVHLSIDYPRWLWRWSARRNCRLHDWTLIRHKNLGQGWIRYYLAQPLPPREHVS